MPSADGTVDSVPTYYEVLGVAQAAPAEEIRHAYRRLAKTAHPDVAGDPAHFQMITEAYDVLSDPARRAAYDRSLRRAPVAAPAAASPRKRRYGRYVAGLLVVAVLSGGIYLAVATARQSVGDDCLVGTWRGQAFEVPFRASIDGRAITASIRGGAGVVTRVAADGTVRSDYDGAELLTGADGSHRIEAAYSGTTIERWRAADGRLTQSGTDVSQLTLRASIDGRVPDQPLAVTVVDREFPYSCSPTALDVGPYRYTR